DGDRGEGPGPDGPHEVGEDGLQLPRLRRDGPGHRLRDAAVRLHGRGHGALPPRRYGRGGLGDRQPDPRRLEVAAPARLAERRFGFLGPRGRRSVHAARRTPVDPAGESQGDLDMTAKPETTLGSFIKDAYRPGDPDGNDMHTLLSELAYAGKTFAR